MRKILFSMCLALVGLSAASAQPDSLTTAEAINSQVWQPFMKHWGERNAEAFNDLHTTGVLRAGERTIREGEAYREEIRQGFGRPQAPPRSISFSFYTRVFDDEVAYETGIYKIEVSMPSGEMRSFYGYFHVVLRMESNTWRIAQDWDVSHFGDEPIGQTHFDEGVPLE